MPFKFASQVQTFEAMSVKASKQHLIDNEDVNIGSILKTIGNPLTLFRFALVVQNQLSAQRFRLCGLILVKHLLNLPRLLVCLAD